MAPEFAQIGTINLIASFLTVFLLGVQLGVSDNTRKIARIAWVITIIILWIIIFIR